jgi:hypothetical protein
LASEGDEAALFFLDRTIKREGDTENARRVLEEYEQRPVAASL